MAVEDKTMQRNVFICSAGHSGSTLLDMMIGSHSTAESLGELVHLPMDMSLNTECVCGAAMHYCTLWPEVMRRMGVDPVGNPYALSLGYSIATLGDVKRTSLMHRYLTRPKIAMKYYQLRYNLPFLEKLTPGFTQGIISTLKVYDHVRILTGKRVIVDSTKHYVRATALYLAQPEKTRVVVLVRDGRGVLYSGLKRGFNRDYSIRAWYNHYRRALQLLDKHVPKTHQILVHYEDIVTNTEQTISNLCEFLDIEYEPNMLNFKAVIHHNVNGNNDMKFSTVAELRLDEAWKTKLEPSDRKYFEQHAGALNQRLGYV